MNTSKQVNVMVGLLMVFAVATLLYFLWDSVRANDAEERQLRENAERGGALFALNCRSCHGLTGKGPIERGGLPGAALNLEQNRPASTGELNALRQRFRDTIRCGRVGTLMPSWSTEQGGPLNQFQIEQLVLLITSEASEEGWAHAVGMANHADEFDPRKELVAAAREEDAVLTMNDTSGLKVEDLLRIDDDPLDDVYEIVSVTGVSGEDNEIQVQRGAAGTKAAAHEAGIGVFKGPIPPGTTITGGSGTPPCGQKQAAAAASPAGGEPVQVTGSLDLQMGDNFFEVDGKRNPTLAVAQGATITVNLDNAGSQIHNMRTSGADGEFKTDDDAVSDPDIVPGGAAATLAFAFAQTGTFKYRCDFHPDEMLADITVTAPQ